MRSLTLPLVLAPVALLALAACGEHQPPPPPAPGAPPPPSAPPADAPAVVAVEAPAVAMDGNCSLDAINNAPAADQKVKAGEGAAATFSGWAATADKQLPPAGTRLVFKGEAQSFAIPLVGGGERPDVAQALGAPALATSGFNTPAGLSAMPAGRYEVLVVFGEPATSGCATQPALVLE